MSHSQSDLPPKAEIVASLEPLVEENMARHVQERSLWMPSELLPLEDHADAEQVRDLRKLPDRARGIPDAVRVSLALNLLTEEGLPHFHRLLAVHMGSDNAWSRWNYLWTAEEDRHGCVLRDYAREARLFDMTAFEGLQYRYLEAGFDPGWGDDPYLLLAYTSLQERATQTAHANTGRLVSKHEPLLQRILGHVASDESRHFRFYRDAFKGLLEVDPTRAMVAALQIMPRLAMPGSSIDGYAEMADVVRRAGIYGPGDYRKVVSQCLDSWGIAGLQPEDAAGREAQERLMAVPERLDKLAGLLETRTRPKTFSFDFVYQRAIQFD
jgi:acyl-[acyl-carrier-protein] desaturase